MLLQSAQLMRLEGKKCGLEAGKKRGPKYQDRDREKEKSENAGRHFSLRLRLGSRGPSEKLQRACLPII